MKKLPRKTRVWGRLCAAWGVTLVWVLMSPQAVSAETLGRELGRDNPFAGFEVPPSQRTPVTVADPAEALAVDMERPDVVMETVVLKFLDATDVVGVLMKMLTTHGAAAANKDTNSIVICDTPENVAKILVEIRKADRPPRQIMVEVVTLDVQLSDNTEIGVSWDLLTENIPEVGYRQAFGEDRVTSTAETDTTVGDATAFNSLGMGGDVSVVIGSVRNVLHMIQEKRETEILASPRALVVSGQTATIKAVEEIPYEEVTDTAAGGSGALTSTQFKDVGVTLQITATIADSNEILLRVDVEQNVRTGESESGVPVVDTRKATTSLCVKDNQTLIFAGLRRQEETKTVNKVPFLGDLPIVGNLFKNTHTAKNNSELVVLLSAHIDEGRTIPAAVSKKRRAFQQNALLSGQDPNEVVGGAYDVDIQIGPPDSSERAALSTN